MDIKSYFPTGIVTGEAFCNREEERALLKKRFQQNAHVVLISPRRYGKSSLIAQFTLDQKTAFAAIDLLPATSSKFIVNSLTDGVGQLLNNLLPKAKNLKMKLLQYFSSMNPVIEISAFGQQVKLTPTEKDPAENIMKLLLSLDEAAREAKKHVIFVMDEFQQIANLDDANSLEAGIRHAVERSKNVFYIFSGSNRTLLEDMFKNKEKPLYYLCDEIKLKRIAKEHYLKFIAQAAKYAWNKEIQVKSLEAILTLTDCHPYYVNRLCRILWDMKQPPDADIVKKIWADYVQEQSTAWVRDIIATLSLNQKAVLASIANNNISEPTGKEFLIKLGISPSSIQRTMGTLINQDYIYQNDKGVYCVLNPVVKAYLENNKYLE